jgi:hypothetical protein
MGDGPRRLPAVLDREPYPVRMLVSFGTNLLSAHPDTAMAQRALKRLEFHVHADFFVNATASYADIILPLPRHGSGKACAPGLMRAFAACGGFNCGRRSSRRSVVALRYRYCSCTAKRLGLADVFFGGEADRGHDAILAPSGLSVADLRAAPGGIELDESAVPLMPYAARDNAGSPQGFPTPTRRVEIYSERLLQHGYAPVPAFAPTDIPAGSAEFPLRLSSAKSVAYCHSQHRNIASLRRLAPDPVVEMARQAAFARGIKEGDWCASRLLMAARSPARSWLQAFRMRFSGSTAGGSMVQAAAPMMPAIRSPPTSTQSTAVADPISGSILRLGGRGRKDLSCSKLRNTSLSGGMRSRSATELQMRCALHS